MKKNIFMVAMLCILTSAIFISCSSEQTADNSAEKKFVIKSPDSKTVTTYIVDTENNRTTRSILNNNDEVVTRNYYYSDSGDLAEVRSASSIAGTSVVNYLVESGRSDSQKTKKTIQVTGTRGDVELIEVEYIYDDDGSALGVIQRDSNGNIYQKGLME